MLADLRCTVFNYQIEFIKDFFEELIIHLNVFQQRLWKQNNLVLLAIASLSTFLGQAFLRDK